MRRAERERKEERGKSREEEVGEEAVGGALKIHCLVSSFPSDVAGGVWLLSRG